MSGAMVTWEDMAEIIAERPARARAFPDRLAPGRIPAARDPRAPDRTTVLLLD